MVYTLHHATLEKRLTKIDIIIKGSTMRNGAFLLAALAIATAVPDISCTFSAGALFFLFSFHDVLLISKITIIENLLATLCRCV